MSVMIATISMLCMHGLVYTPEAVTRKTDYVFKNKLDKRNSWAGCKSDRYSKLDENVATVDH